jgi:hypothetical protein
MGGSFLRSNSALAAVCAVAAAAGACERTETRERETTSIHVEITAPSDLGSEGSRLPDGDRTVSVQLTALDDQGDPDTGFEGPVSVQAHFLGSLTPTGINVLMTAGAGTATVALPPVLGPTYLWVEDTIDVDRVPTYATGTSPVLWYREPLVGDISTPDLGAPSVWLEASPYEGKQVRVETSKHGATDGHLVVTGIYAQGYTLSDVDCSVSPCVADPFNHVFVFSFNRPRDEEFNAIEIGHQVAWVSGGIGEFNGYTELNFPQTALLKDQNGEPIPPDEGLVPEPAVIQASWLTNGALDPNGLIKLEEQESGLVAVVGGVLCPLDDDFTTYKQWKLDVGNGCSNVINIISAGNVADFDPSDYPAGTGFSRVVGTLRAVNIGTFHVWIVQPRRSSDITL